MKHYKISYLLLLLMFERVFNRLGHGSVVEKNRGRRRGGGRIRGIRRGGGRIRGRRRSDEEEEEEEEEAESGER